MSKQINWQQKYNSLLAVCRSYKNEVEELSRQLNTYRVALEKALKNNYEANKQLKKNTLDKLLQEAKKSIGGENEQTDKLASDICN